MPSTSVTRKRAKPGSRGGGRFFHIEVRPSAQFVAFRVQDVGAPGGVERVGSWLCTSGFCAKPRRNIPEREKPTRAMRRAQLAKYQEGAGRGASAPKERRSGGNTHAQ